jgi:hypothetical protein
MPHALHKLMGKPVVVDASGTTYSGILREVTERDLVLWTPDGWCTITHDRVNGVRPAPEPAPLSAPGTVKTE